jgi:hypothetical protein
VVLAATVLVLLAWLVPAAGTGDIDPGGALLAGLGLALTLSGTLWTGRMAHLAMRWQDSDVAGWAERLASLVKEQEQAQHHRLLGGSPRTIDVRFAFVPAPAHNASGAASCGWLEEIAGYYRTLQPGRLMVTGAPGAGKTVLALHLMLLLLTGREPSVKEAVPVRLSLSSFDPDRYHQRLDGWITAHLVDVYKLPRRAAVALVRDRLVLPVLDGLDEMDEEHPAWPTPASAAGYASRASTALRAMNHWRDGTGRGQLIVTCRTARYRALEHDHVWAEDAARIDIRPVAADSAWDFLAARTGGVARWEPVMNALAAHPAGALAQALSTPWRLTLATVVYEERDPHTGRFLREPKDLVRMAESGELHGYLLDRYLKAAVHAPGEPGGRWPQRPLDPAEVWRHLAVLARYLYANTANGNRTVAGHELSGSDIVLHELWPLAGSRAPRVVGSVLMLLAGLLGWCTVLLTSNSDNPFATAFPVGGGVLIVMVCVAAYVVAWPKPTRVSLRSLTSFRRVGQAAAVTLLIGLLGGAASVVYYSSSDQDSFDAFPDGLWASLNWPSIAGSMAMAILVYVTLSGRTLPAGEPHSTLPSDPRMTLRSDLTTWMLSAALIGGLEYLEWSAEGDRYLLMVSGPVMVLIAAGYGLLVILNWGLLFSVKDIFPATRGFRGALGGPASLRYLSLLLCTRGRLPWRLGRLLQRCYDLGLMRVTGVAYQFRHRELQEHLAARPHPPCI